MKLISRVVLLLVFSLSACQQAVIPVTGDQGVNGEAVASVQSSDFISDFIEPERTTPEAASDLADPGRTPNEMAPDQVGLADTDTPSPFVPGQSTPVPTDEFTEDSWIQTDATVFLPFVSNVRPTPYIPPQGDNRWATVAGNAERTSWTPEEVSGQLTVDWYRPIEAYIPQNVQIIGSDGLVFISTARGLYALNATNGSEAWRFDTELPLGNSPTVANGVVYVGGYDRKLYALRVSDGVLLWAYSGAGAGYSTNPLVVDGRVILGNRDGAMYAIGAHGSANQGQLLWKYQTGGMIDLSAAYKDGVVYFASNDNYAYALRADNGSLVWRSDKLPGDGYHSYWPVIYQDKVIFSAASGYRTGYNPGTGSIKDPQGNDYGKIFDIERDDLYPGSPTGTMFGNPVSGQNWANGKTVLDASRLINYHEAKPWRRVLVVLNRSDGREYTFDSDRDGRAEYMPALFWGTHSGNRYPPIVGQDGIIYFSNPMNNNGIPQGRVMGWLPGYSMLSQVGGQGAIDEPQAISIGGSLIYRSLCCDRVGDWFSTTSNRSGNMWGYNNTLNQQAPGYDQMWYKEYMQLNDPVRLRGNYGNVNGIYHNHGDQNPPIPYNGRVYIHRSNAIIAFGPGSGPGRLPLLTIGSRADSQTALTTDQLRIRLESEVQKIMATGFLRPGYYNAGQYSNYSQFGSYFENPGDTLYTLSIAYPYLSTGMQNQVRGYLQTYFQTYFQNQMVARVGWATGEARESMPIPPEVEAAMNTFSASQASDSRFSWQYPPFNFYALWKYVQLVAPSEALSAYNLIVNRVQAPLPSAITNDFLNERPFELNAYIAGYIGFLRLQELANRTTQDADLRNRVQNELNRLQNLRSTNFNKDTPYVPGNGSYHLRTMNISRNFIFMTPELGDYLNQSIRSRVQTAIDEYSRIAPYWFVARFNAVPNEGVRHNLYDAPALFHARAYILKQSRAELTRYLDTPAFERGDLFYIQNLVASLQAP